MSRIPRLFLVFIAGVMVVVVGFVVFYKGTELTKLTFNPDRRSQPLLLLTLRDTDNLAYIEEQTELIDQRNQLFVDVEHASIFRGRTEFTTDGTYEPVWHSVRLDSYSKTSEYINVTTSPEYISLDEELIESNVGEFAQYAGHVNVDKVYTDPIVLLFAERVSDANHERVLNAVTRTLAPYRGIVDFAVKVDNIVGSSASELNYLALIKFERWAPMLEWLGDTIRKSQFVLLEKEVERISLVVAVPE